MFALFVGAALAERAHDPFEDFVVYPKAAEVLSELLLENPLLDIGLAAFPHKAGAMVVDVLSLLYLGLSNPGSYTSRKCCADPLRPQGMPFQSVPDRLMRNGLSTCKAGIFGNRKFTSLFAAAFAQLRLSLLWGCSADKTTKRGSLFRDDKLSRLDGAGLSVDRRGRAVL
ncbi:MAG TPA: hypothetical protein VNF99_15680 [Stellaceae bacterium]|nr:hypothetical protein [Stellaceae bacterium]